jgi:hypothetical protein
MIQEIAGTILQTVAQVLEKGEQFAVWGGHHVKNLIADYMIPATEKLKEVAEKAWQLFDTLVKSGPGGIFALSGMLFLAGIAAFKLADKKAYEEDTLIKGMWKAVGVTAFIAATAFTSLGIVVYAKTGVV